MHDFKISQTDDVISIHGALTALTVEGALAKAKPLIAYEARMQFNLEGIENCDSAGLAFITAILRESKKKRTKLSFIHVPRQMRDLSRVSGLDSLLIS